MNDPLPGYVWCSSHCFQEGSSKKKKAYATLKNIDLLFKQIRECGLKSSFFSLNASVGSALLYKESSQVHVKHEMIYQVLFYPSLHAEGQRCLDNF